MPRFLTVLDVDSTLIQDEVIELLAEAAGVRDEVAGITDRAMAGELDFAESLAARVATLAGLPVSVFAEVSERLRPTGGADRLVEVVRSHGGVVGVVSGGFHETLDPLAGRLGLDRWRANRLGVVSGRLTGETTGPIIDAAAKAESLRTWAEEFGIPLDRTIAIGDGANDLEMMRVAGLSIAFNAKPVVRAQADLVVADRELSQVLAVMGLSSR
ncbi:phosphoserine phosphatase SerB [Frigoribacterium sp. Leaf172]|uniref:phosphoserine phosphatase SerB n=1 Tax=Frigoribacterium sp. Leaf172 TaxID=1736285 RepID=UPI0006F931A4|nr:phosphoserine phosphatase SerB [Frigoribacterium sp. Leaf172]KQR64389.1 phosphoserine phosphatase [Frigoribacterium sp. Leaf172]